MNDGTQPPTRSAVDPVTVELVRGAMRAMQN